MAPLEKGLNLAGDLLLDDIRNLDLRGHFVPAATTPSTLGVEPFLAELLRIAPDLFSQFSLGPVRLAPVELPELLQDVVDNVHPRDEHPALVLEALRVEFPFSELSEKFGEGPGRHLRSDVEPRDVSNIFRGLLLPGELRDISSDNLVDVLVVLIRCSGKLVVPPDVSLGITRGEKFGPLFEDFFLDLRIILAERRTILPVLTHSFNYIVVLHAPVDFGDLIVHGRDRTRCGSMAGRTTR